MLNIKKNNTNNLILPITLSKNTNQLYVLFDGEYDASKTFIKVFDNYNIKQKYYSITIVEGINGIKLNTGEYKFKLYSSVNSNITDYKDTSLTFLLEDTVKVEGENYVEDIFVYKPKEPEIFVYYPNKKRHI